MCRRLAAMTYSPRISRAGLNTGGLRPPKPVPHGPGPCVARHRVGAQKVGQRLTVAAGRCIDSANRRAAAKSEAATAICRPLLAVLGNTEGGPRAAISRVLCPLRDGDHLSGAPVARRL